MADTVPSGDVERLMTSLALPAGTQASAAFREASPNDIPLLLHTLVDRFVVDAVWRRWNPDESAQKRSPEFQRALQDLLGRGVGMGYRIDRFREMARRLPEPDQTGENWLGPFEQAIEDRGRATVRLFLNPADHDGFLSAAPAAKDNGWDGMLSIMGDGLFYELGIICPRVDTRPNHSVPADHIRIVVNDAELPDHRGLRADQMMVNDTPERLRLLDVLGTSTDNPANANECAIIAAEDAARCDSAGLTTWDRTGYAVLALSAALRAMAGGFVNRYLVDHYLDMLREVKPHLIAEADRRLRRDVIVAALRGLIEEGISIRDMTAILDELVTPRTRVDADTSRVIVFVHGAYSIATHATTPEDDNLLRLRAASKRYIAHKYTRGQNTLIVYLVAAETERRLQQPYLLSDAERTKLLRAMHEELGSLPRMAATPVILTSEAIRRRLRREIRDHYPRVAVLSYQELSPEMNIQPIARIDPELEPVDPSFAEICRAVAGWVPSQTEEIPQNLSDSTDPIGFVEGQTAPIRRRAIGELTEAYSLGPFHSQLCEVVDVFLRAFLAVLSREDSTIVADLARRCARRMPATVRWSRGVELLLRIAEAVRQSGTQAPGDLAVRAAFAERVDGAAQRSVVVFIGELAKVEAAVGESSS